MIIVFETMVLVGYMINNYIGIALMLLLCVWERFYYAKKEGLYRASDKMILALPMAYIGIAGTSMHHMLSWYNLFLVAFIVKIAQYYSFKIPFKKSDLQAIIVILGCLFVNLFWSTDLIGSFAEIAQILIMIIPIMIIHAARNTLLFEKDDTFLMLYRYADICVATALAMIIQYFSYYYLHREIGVINLTGANRVQFYVLFRGASILPIYLGTGEIFFLIECFEKKLTLEKLIKIVIIFFATMLNTSRTGLFSVIIVLGLVCIKYLVLRPSFKGVFFTIVGVVGAFYAVNYITKLRNGLSGFLDANGRFQTWRNGMSIWSNNLKNIFFGEGFTGEKWIGIAKPHNFIIQTLAQCGFIVTLIVIILLAKYIKDNWRSPYIFLILSVILSGMLVTDFYANAFTTVIFILVDLYTNSEHNIDCSSIVAEA